MFQFDRKTQILKGLVSDADSNLSKSATFVKTIDVRSIQILIELKVIRKSIKFLNEIFKSFEQIFEL